MAGELARHSSHPLSRAVAATSSEPLHIDHWEEARGCGVSGKLTWTGGAAEVALARLGSLKWLEEGGVDDEINDRPRVEQLGRSCGDVVGESFLQPFLEEAIGHADLVENTRQMMANRTVSNTQPLGDLLV